MRGDGRHNRYGRERALRTLLASRARRLVLGRRQFVRRALHFAWRQHGGGPHHDVDPIGTCQRVGGVPLDAVRLRYGLACDPHAASPLACLRPRISPEVTSGAWGILWYREVEGRAEVAVWILAAAWTLAMVLLLGMEKKA